MSRESDLGWLAGMIDGDGCIGLYAPRRARGHVIYIVSVSVANTDRHGLERCRNLAGCGSIQTRARSATPKWQRFYCWRADSRNAEHVLQLVAPYLFMKREQCRLALQASALVFRHGSRPNPHRDQLEELRRQLQALNRKGPRSIAYSVPVAPRAQASLPFV